jgi:hypothetical protein
MWAPAADGSSHQVLLSKKPRQPAGFFVSG